LHTRSTTARGRSYDCSLAITDTTTHTSKHVAQHEDKVIQARWHCSDLAFASSSADRTVRLWCASPSSL
jgi:WD repeat-containing protein 47